MTYQQVYLPLVLYMQNISMYIGLPKNIWESEYFFLVSLVFFVLNLVVVIQIFFINIIDIVHSVHFLLLKSRMIKILYFFTLMWTVMGFKFFNDQFAQLTNAQ